MNKLLFRADGNAQTGLGHVMRCLALADMLGDTYDRRFAIIQPDKAVIQRIEEKGLSVIILATNDVAELLTHTTRDDVVVLDGYEFDTAFQREIRQRASKLVFIDDLTNGQQVANVVINHTGGVAKNEYDAGVYTQFYLGPHYALLRPEFMRPDGFGKAPENGPIFVNMGGADPQNTSLKVLESIRLVDSTLQIHLVLGPFYPNRAAIDSFQSQLPNLTILQDLSAVQMVDELRQCQLAITSCSTIAYEVCAINRPLITVLTADNQARLAQFMAEEKLALSVNFPTLLNRLTPVISLENMLKLAIQGFQFMPETVAESLKNQRQFFDGRSPERLRHVFHEITGRR